MKNVKKLFAGVAVMAALVSFGGAGVAEAGTDSCPPHGPYEEGLMEILQWYDIHYPDMLIPIYDEAGRFLGYMCDGNGNCFKVKCEMTQTRYHIGIYCRGKLGTCNRFVNDYFYADPIIHTYCSVG